MCLGCDLSRRRFLLSAFAATSAAAFARGFSASETHAPAPVLPGGSAAPRQPAAAARNPDRDRPAAALDIVAASAAGLAAGSAGQVVLGGDGHRYRVEEGWAKLPPGKRFVDAPAVCVDDSDNVYVFTRGPDPVMVFDRDGNYLRSWGMDVGFVSAHGAHMSADGYIYLTDHAGHGVRKCTPDGRVVMTIGTPGQAAPRYSGEPFNLCTHTALSPEGDIFVTDGYGNARVHKYSAAGKHLLSWGESGTGPGQFQLPHNIACDDDGNVYVADRENHRIQVFDRNGRYMTQWNNLGRPCGLFVTAGPDPLVIVGELGPHFVRSFSAGARNVGPRILIMNIRGEVLSYLGTEPLGTGVGQFIAPHGIARDSRGDIYVAEVSNTYWPELFGEAPDGELRCLQKLVKIS